jgi:hypothetical protein
VWKVVISAPVSCGEGGEGSGWRDGEGRVLAVHCTVNSSCLRQYWQTLACSAGIFKQSMVARNRVGTGLSYRPARLHILAELVPWNRFLDSLKVKKFGLSTEMTADGGYAQRHLLRDRRRGTTACPLAG